jgi:PKHD-type hydroxylase
MHRIFEFLSGDDLDELDKLLDAGTFSDGLKTAGGAGQSIKSNVQLDVKDPNGPVANALVHRALMKSEEFKSYAYPYKVSDISFSRYLTGMKYGEHTDNPVNWGAKQVIRSDLSFTIFLSSADEYEGGELVANVLGDEQSIKLNRGDMVIYPSGLLHRVNEVKSGCRKTAIGWLQSLIPQQERREIIRSIYNVRNEILVNSGRSKHFMCLDFACANLQRMWTKI